MAASKPPPEIKVKDFIDAVAVAGARSRLVLIFLVVTSVLSFASFWKTLPAAWMNARADAAGAGVEYVATAAATKLADYKGPEKKTLNDVYLYTFPIIEDLDKSHLKHESPDSRIAALKRLEVGREVAIAKKLRNLQHATDFRDALEKQRLENVTIVRLPLFGVTFDVNDSGMLSGITFTILLLMLRIALKRECESFWTLKDVLQTVPDRRTAYLLLSTTQVMTVAPHLRDHNRDPFWKVVPKVLLWMPPCIQVTSFIWDALTWEIGFRISSFVYFVDILISFTAISVILILTWQSMRALEEIDKILEAIAVEVAKEDTQDQTSPPAGRSSSRSS